MKGYTGIIFSTEINISGGGDKQVTVITGDILVIPGQQEVRGQQGGRRRATRGRRRKTRGMRRKTRGRRRKTRRMRIYNVDRRNE